MSQSERAERARLFAEAVLDRKAQDVVALDLHELTSFTDSFVIATGTSDRHVRSVCDGVVETAKARNDRPLGVEGYESGEWVLIDLGDVVVHVFQEEAREHFGLERLWAEAPAVLFDETGGAIEQLRNAP